MEVKTDKIAIIPQQWWTSGMIFKDRLVCQYHTSGFTGGMWYGDSPLDNPTSIVLFQMVVIFIFTRSINFLLQPFRQSMIVAQIVAGFVIGPSCLTHYRVFANKLFPAPGRYVLKTISSFGFMLHLFVLGVKIDMTAIRSAGPKSIVIGLSGVLFSLFLGSSAFYIVRQLTELDQSLFSGIRLLIVFNSLTFFMVTSSFLQDLKIANSEVGRLASSSSLIIDLLGLLGTTVSLTWSGVQSPNMPPRWMCFASVSLYYAVLFCVFRPLVLYVVSRTPEGATTMKQTHLMMVLAILMLTWYWGEALGQRFATFLFGLSLPDGPPLGTALSQKIELFTSRLLLPVFCSIAGWRTNLSAWKGNRQVWVVELIFLTGQIGKILGTILTSAAVGVSLEDAVPLGFMMSFKGIMEVASLGVWSDQSALDERLFCLAMINIVLFTGVAFPLAQHLYDPSSKYNIVKKRRITNIGENGELQVLVCIHNEESVPGIVRILELSKLNNTGGSVSVFTIQLIQLTGSSMPILAPLHKYKKSTTNFSHYEHVVNAFNQFEMDSQGQARIQHLVSVTPYNSMHNDICSLAHDKRTNIIITPFYKRWGIDGKVDACSPQIKEVNRKVMRKAPCSVAVLIDKKGSAGGSIPVTSVTVSGPCIYHIVVLFIGGSDDHEALAIARRMAEHPSVRLTVLWLKAMEYQPLLQDAEDDLRVITEFHMKSKRNDRIEIREEIIVDGIGTTKAVLSMQYADLFVVGKYHEPDCPAILGLTDWNESPEIGAIGDMLATSDFMFSILVVQQQPRIDWDLNSSRHSKMDDYLSVSSFNESFKTSKSHKSVEV